LVSSGTWRYGKNACMHGMMQSSENHPGERSLTIEKIRLLNSSAAIVDTRYEIKNGDGSTRKMWSTFIVVLDGKSWKISGIRNMLPAS